jgi:hypothetical protein|tara:strand:+ start:73 stop:432 length:360 start_codon:yes stop_codon:yes gene_type:complete
MAKTSWTGISILPDYYNGTVNATKVVVTAAPTLIQSISVLNATAAEAYLQIYDKATGGVTVGTTAPSMVFGVGAEGNPHFLFPKPIYFPTGLVIASTTARAGDSGAVQEVNITYATGVA